MIPIQFYPKILIVDDYAPIKKGMAFANWPDAQERFNAAAFSGALCRGKPSGGALGSWEVFFTGFPTGLGAFPQLLKAHPPR